MALLLDCRHAPALERTNLRRQTGRLPTGNSASAGGQQYIPHQLVAKRGFSISWWPAGHSASAGGQEGIQHQLVASNWWLFCTPHCTTLPAQSTFGSKSPSTSPPAPSPHLQSPAGYVCVCVHVYARACMCMHVYACVCMCMHVYACVCM